MHNTRSESILSCLQWNCRSVKDKRTELDILIDEVSPDIIALNETWLDQSENFCLRGYRTLRKDRDDGYGGVLIACKDTLCVSEIRLTTNLECVCCSLSYGQQESLAIMCIYMPPNKPIIHGEIDQLFDQIPGQKLIMGDFNAHGQQWGGVTDDARARVLINVFDDHNLVSLNTGKYTRIACPPVQNSAIDLALCTANIALSFDWKVQSHPSGSDHLPIVIQFLQGANTEPRHSSIKNLTRQIDWDNFQTYVQEALTCPQVDVPLDTRYDNYVKTIQDCALRSQSRQSPAFSQRIPQKTAKDWWNSECQDKYLAKTDSFKTFIRTGGRAAYILYLKHQAQFKKLVKTRKTESWRNFCSSLTMNSPMATMWNMGKRYRGLSTSNSPAISVQWISDFCSNVAPPTAAGKPYSAYVPEVNTHPMCSPFTADELELSLKNCNNSSPGLDGISFDIIKNLPFIAKERLIALFNEIFSSVDCPEQWFVCKVVAIHKPGKDPAIATSYRPICLLSCIRKIFEKLVQVRLDFWAEKHQILSPTQFGFRKGKSTQDCLATLSVDLQITYSQKATCLAVFMDISAAYDNVDIGILCDRLIFLGVPVNMVLIIAKLFGKRIMRFFANKTHVGTRHSYKGLAQGSVLSPLLYNLYTSHIDQLTEPRIKLLQYADDIVIYVSGKNESTMQTTMQNTICKMSKWFGDIGLEISDTKSEVVVFSRNYKVQSFQLDIDGIPLKISSQFKYLGVTFDAKCRWQAQIDDTARKCTKRINFLRSISGSWWGAHPSDMLTIFKATVRAILEYGAVAIIDLSASRMLRLQRIQWRALRTCLGLIKTTHTASLEVLSGIPPLDIRYRQIAAKFFTKTLTGPSPILRLSVQTLNTCVPRGPIASQSGHILELEIPTYQIFPCYETELAIHIFTPQISWEMKSSLEGVPKDIIPLVAAQHFAAIKAAMPRDIHMVYTDGSLICGQTGGAVHMENGCSEQFKLPQPASVYVAEQTAILTACNLISRSNLSGQFCIASDSMSAILAIEAKGISARATRLLVECRASLFELRDRGVDVRILWIPSHCGITGNETADELAKDAAVNGVLRETTPEWSAHVSRWRGEAQESWQHRWSEGTLGRFCYSVLPQVQSKPWFAKMDGTLGRQVIVTFSRISANHNLLKNHINRMHIIDSPLCEHCSSYETVDHVLWFCPAYSQGRPELINLLEKEGFPAPQCIRTIAATCHTAQIFLFICNFLAKHNIRV